MKSYAAWVFAVCVFFIMIYGWNPYYMDARVIVGIAKGIGLVSFFIMIFVPATKKS